MRARRLTALSAFLAASLLAVGMAGNAEAVSSTPASQVPQALTDVDLEQRIGERLPLDLLFRDEQGRSVRLGDAFDGRPVILAPVYYRCPMLCTLILEGLARSLKVLKLGAETDYQLVAFSINPAEGPADAAERKARALHLFGRDGGGEGWSFLTGEESSIRALAEAIGFRYTYQEESGEFLHVAAVVVATPDGTISRYFFGTEYAPRDLRLGLVEASQGAVGSPVDRLLLYCYRYDPATGQYTLLVMRLVRLGAAVTILALAGFIGTMVYMERRRTAEQAALAAAQSH
jgi:protein SCO1